MKPRVLMVGGKACGIPGELRERFFVVRHVSNEMGGWASLGRLRVDYVFIIVNFTDHSWIERVRARVRAPIVFLRKGWPHMKARLEALGILPPGFPTSPHPPTPPGPRRCAYPPCRRFWTEEAPFQYGIYCCKVCHGAARRKGLVPTV